MIMHFRGGMERFKGATKFTLRPPTIMIEDLGSSIYGLPQDSDAPRGDTLSNILWDEMAFLPRAEEMYNSIWHANTKGRIIGVSTPKGKRNIFYMLSHDLRSYDQKPELYRNKERILPGMSLTHNKNTFDTLWLHYSADPEKNKAWAEERKKGIPEELWSQDMELDFSSSSSNRMFSGFNEDVHVRKLKPLPGKPIIRGIDFGYHHPACIIGQLVEGQLRILREIMGTDIPINLFGKQIKEYCEKEYPGYVFKDFCDPAGKHASDKGTQTSIDILRRMGFRLSYKYVSINSGINILRNLLVINTNPDNTKYSRFLIDESCCDLIDGLKGQYQRNDDDSPVEDNFYEHVFDALRYMAIGVISPTTFMPYAQTNLITMSHGTEYATTGY